jgi:type II secretory pathway pseudopilin PulG
MTLAEILIALTVLSVGLLALLALVPISVYGIQEGKQRTTAMFLAEQRLEQLKATAWTAIPAVDCLSTSGTTSASWSFSGGTAPAPGGICTPTSFPDETPTGDATATPATKLTGPYGSYTRQVRVRPCDAAGAGCGVSDAAARLVTVQVSYTPLLPAGGVAPTQRPVQLTVLLAQR